MERQPDAATEVQPKPDARQLVLVVINPDGTMSDIPTGLYLAVGDGVVGFPGDSVPDLQRRLRTLADWLERKAILLPRIITNHGGTE
jgi:hypothetical protein